MVILLKLLIFLTIIYQNHSLILKGSLESDEDWKFVGKFCFLTSGGKVNFKLSYSMEYAYHNMLLYYDDQWPQVYPSKPLTCREKEYQLKSEQIFNLTSGFFDCTFDSPNRGGIICDSSRTIVNARPRWWFVVFSRCFPKNNTKSGIQIDYNFEFTNGNDTFTKHFSADEMGIFEMSIALVATYTVLLIITVVVARILAIKKLLHTTFKIFLISIIIQFLSYIFTMGEYAQFSNSGLYTQGTGLMGRLLDATSQTIFLLLLILVGKGYTITRGMLRTVTVIKLIIVFCCYVAAYIISFCYSEALFDSGLVNYFYSSPGGLALIIIKLVIGWVWFCYAIVFTIKNYPEKRKFYYAVSIFYSIWFWASPIIIIITNYAIAQHTREKVGFIIQSFIILVGHVFFLSLTFPNKANKNFPYHVSTNHVGVVDEKNETENYPHHREDEGGNKEFEAGRPNEITLQSMFVVQNPKSKYEIDESDVS